MNNSIVKLFKSPKTVLNINDISILLGETNKDNLKSKISYYVKQGSLVRIARGVFTKGKDYNIRELATSLYSPSYISFETVLRDNGLIFQHYDTLFLAGPWTLTRKIGQNTFNFRKLKKEVLFNSTGINFINNYCIAEKERAFLDMIYVFPKYYFDNLSSLNWEKCFDIVKIYENKQMVKRLNKYYKENVK